MAHPKRHIRRTKLLLQYPKSHPLEPNQPPSKCKDLHLPRPQRCLLQGIPYIKTACPGTPLALPDYTPHTLKHVHEQALYSAHAHRCTSPSSHIMILSNWEHNPYLARNFHTTYVQKLTSIPCYFTYTPTPNILSPKLNIYLKTNEKALELLDRTHILTTLQTAITELLGKHIPRHLPQPP
jgi:hypothetical protein